MNSDLANKTCKELREIAKELNIVGRWNMNKALLIGEIIHARNIKKEGTPKAKKTTVEYLNNAEVGTLVAFKKNKSSDAVISGKLVSFKDDEIIVETKMGSIYNLNPSDIIWVKTGSRWPRWVFDLFRAGKEVDIDNAVSKVEEQNT